MKIALAMETTFDCDAGVQQYFKGLGRYLISRGHDVRFLATHASENSEFKGKVYSTGKAFNPIFNTTSIPLGIYSPASRFDEILEKEKFDVLHVGTPVSPFSMAKLVRDAECPVVGTFMIHTQSGIQRFFSRAMSVFPIDVASHIDSFTAPNQKTVEDANHIIPGTYTVIPHATEAAQLKSKATPLPQFDDGKLNIFFLGRLENRKGVHILLDILPDILEQVKDIRVIIAGDGPMRKELEEIASKNKVASHVVFEGYIDEKLKPNYFASADLCVFPATHGECFGIVLIECLSYGKIPVAFANEGYGSVLENLPDVLVENRNREELTRRIIHFLTDKEDREKTEVLCEKEAIRYSWESVGPQFEKIYRDLQTNS